MNTVATHTPIHISPLHDDLPSSHLLKSVNPTLGDSRRLPLTLQPQTLSVSICSCCSPSSGEIQYGLMHSFLNHSTCPIHIHSYLNFFDIDSFRILGPSSPLSSCTHAYALPLLSALISPATSNHVCSPIADVPCLPCRPFLLLYQDLHQRILGRCLLLSQYMPVPHTRNAHPSSSLCTAHIFLA